MQLGYRFAHILRRMLPIAMYLLQKDGTFLTGHDLFLKRIGAAYHAFIESTERSCRSKCQEDLLSTTRYVTWSLHNRSRSSMKAMLCKVSMTAMKTAFCWLLLTTSSLRHYVDDNAMCLWKACKVDHQERCVLVPSLKTC